MLQLGDVVLTLTLLPYAALGTALFLMWTLRWLLSHSVLDTFRRLLREIRELTTRKSPPLPAAKEKGADGSANRIRATREDH
jgi:hypothetical protein